MKKSEDYSPDLQEFWRKGGLSKTPVQTEARRVNMAKARVASAATRRQRKFERAELTMRLVAEGATEEEIARELGIQPQSVQSAIYRARQTLAGPLAALDEVLKVLKAREGDR